MLIKNTDILKVLNKLKPMLRQKIDTLLGPNSESKNSLLVEYKGDQSPVTEIDLYISNLFKSEISHHFPQVNFYSEEDQGTFKFPLCILDPVDGTKELVEGRDEWVISFGIYQDEYINSPKNFSWIYNPRTLFEISSEGLINKGSVPEISPESAMVSRTEFTAGDNSRYEASIDLLPLGSIAYKLALLASGLGKIVFSKRDKNIWDILAGTHICAKNKIYCYQNGKKLEIISQELFLKDFLWCKEIQLSEFSFIFEN